MNKLFTALIACLFLSLVPIEINHNTLTVFYSLVGVLFSVGMSLLIAFNSSRITSDTKKNEIRDRMHKIRNTFIFVVIMASIVFVVYSIADKIKDWEIKWYDFGCFELKSMWSFPVLLFLIYCCTIFVSNFLDVQELYEDIDDKIQIEEKRRTKEK